MTEIARENAVLQVLVCDLARKKGLVFVVVTFINYTPAAAATIEQAAAFCYDSKPTESYKILKNCIKHGHDSVTEHAVFTFEVTGLSRACLAQLTRHRIGTAFSVRSQRYCKETRARFVLPPSIADRPEAVTRYTDAVNNAQAVYNELLSLGVPAEDARFVLPQATETALALSFNVRALIHFCNLRLCTRAQWEIRELAEKLRECVQVVSPDIASYMVPNCVKLGYCPEAKSCGRNPTLPELINGAETRGYFQALADTMRGNDSPAKGGKDTDNGNEVRV